MARYYLRIEAANLDDFLFDTIDLSTIRGSGLLLLDAIGLLDLDRDPFKELPKLEWDVLVALRQRLDEHRFETISVGASIGLFSFDAKDDEAAEGLRKAIQDLFSSDTEHAYRHVTYLIDVAVAADKDDFPRDRERLIAKNRWRQLQSPNFVLSPHPADWAEAETFCHFTNLRQAEKQRPGEKPSYTPDRNLVQVSASAKERRRFGRSEKHDFYRRFPPPDSARKAEIVASQHFEELTLVRKPRSDHDDPLAWEVGNLCGKMAVLYVDGNRFSERQADCVTPDALREWDRHIREERRAFMNTLLDEIHHDPTWLTRNESNPRVLRMEVLLWGGDEFMFVLPAWHGWWVANFLFKRDWCFGDRPLTHSAGLVFCNHKAPIARVKAVADDLCKLAKSAGEADDNKLAYLTLESFDNVGLDLDAFFKGFLPKGFDPSDWVISGDDLEAWQEGIRVLKEELPKTRVQREAFRASRGADIDLHALLSKGGREEGVDLERTDEAWRALRSYSERRAETGHASPCPPSSHLARLRALHLSLLWDYVAPDLPADYPRG